MALELLQELGPGDLLVLDRGYPGYQMFQAVIKQGADSLVRLPKDGLFQEARAFLARGKRDGKITVSPSQKLLRENPHENYPPLTLRMGASLPPSSFSACVPGIRPNTSSAAIPVTGNRPFSTPTCTPSPFSAVVFPTLVYDNLTAAVRLVLRGKGRVEQTEFTNHRQDSYVTPWLKPHRASGWAGIGEGNLLVFVDVARP